MIDIIRTASTLQFTLGSIAFGAAVLIMLQALVNRGVWAGYIALFLGSVIGLAVTLR